MSDDVCAILLVEDDEDDAFFFRRMLARAGFDGTIVEKKNPSEAWLYLKETSERKPPDLIVCDGMWKEDGGLDLVLWLRGHPVFRDVPFVLYSHAISPQQLRRSTEAGVNAIIEKGEDAVEAARELRSAFLLLPEYCRSWLK